MVAVSKDPLHQFSKSVVSEITLIEGWGVEGMPTQDVPFSTVPALLEIRRSPTCVRSTSSTQNSSTNSPVPVTPSLRARWVRTSPLAGSTCSICLQGRSYVSATTQPCESLVFETPANRSTPLLPACFAKSWGAQKTVRSNAKVELWPSSSPVGSSARTTR